MVLNGPAPLAVLASLVQVLFFDLLGNSWLCSLELNGNGCDPYACMEEVFQLAPFLCGPVVSLMLHACGTASHVFDSF